MGRCDVTHGPPVPYHLELACPAALLLAVADFKCHHSSYGSRLISTILFSIYIPKHDASRYVAEIPLFITFNPFLTVEKGHFPFENSSQIFYFKFS